jgi:hypothetical protein
MIVIDASSVVCKIHQARSTPKSYSDTHLPAGAWLYVSSCGEDKQLLKDGQSVLNWSTGTVIIGRSPQIIH